MSPCTFPACDLANPATGTWALLLVHADGTACVVAVGEDWRAVPYEVGERS